MNPPTPAGDNDKEIEVLGDARHHLALRRGWRMGLKTLSNAKVMGEQKATKPDSPDKDSK